MADDYTVTTIDLLRHGQCEGGEIFRGSTDVPLTQTGWQQMHNAVAGANWDHLISSSLKRCREFSEQLAQRHTTPLVICDQLQEIHFGDWEGVDMAIIQEKYQTSLQAFWADPVNHCPPNAESILDFRNRVVQSFTDTMTHHQGKHLLFVTHGAVIRVLMCELLNMPLTSISSIAVPYACLTRFKHFSMQGTEPWSQLCFHNAPE